MHDAIATCVEGLRAEELPVPEPRAWAAGINFHAA
jgi:hypothetical protein